MLSVLAFVALGLFPTRGTAQATPKATCLAGFNWSFNTLNQSPCDVASSLAGVCIGADFTLAPLDPGFVYLGPQPANANSCRCSSVYYSLLSACAVCQDRNFIRWSAYKANCTVVYDQVFLQPIPSGVRVPHYAYLDIEAGDTFNATLAQAAGGVESTSVPSSTGGSLATPSSSSASPVGAKKKSNAGAIAGGVIGGLIALALIAGLVVWLLRRRRNQSPTSASYQPAMASQNPVSAAHTGSSYPATPAPRVYDPNDPSTFPSNMNEQPGYNPYATPPPDHQQQPYPAQMTPNYTGASQPSFPTQVTPNYTGTSQPSYPRPQYTGAPEL
ncbi:hypothetical protein GALMADRAFT_251199 [Galerina marginata CBS 339.88]|uniref:Uncharacterized protein n=1 Tax=Galerina marginata (strain CBS 339.88) TaxID=685588 RepID=A0A067SRL1_GALM3|nr:hypothetical protein GALMADRAFT_251199 [Galerina marginata CBS 339.88]